MIIIAVAAVGVLAVTGSRDQQDAAKDTLAGATIDSGTLPHTVPFRRVAGHIVVDVVVADAEEPLPLMLDTGAPTTVSAEFAERYGGEPAGQIPVLAVDGSIVAQDVVPIRSMAIGSAVFGDIGAIDGYVEHDNPLGCISPHGLLGASLMRAAVWQIDYGRDEVTIAAGIGGLDHIDGAASLEFTGHSAVSPSPVITIAAGDGELTFVVDTGSDGWLSSNPADLEAAGVTVGPDAPRIDALAAGSAGTFPVRIDYGVADLDIGGSDLHDVPLASIGSLPEGLGNIGNGFLSRFVVTIDWPDRRLYLDPLGDGPVSAPPPQSAGITWDGERVVVGSLVAGSDADRAGVEPGAPVQSVDGTDVSGATRDDFCELLVALGEDPFDLTIDGEERSTVSVAPVSGFFEPLGD